MIDQHERQGRIVDILVRFVKLAHQQGGLRPDDPFAAATEIEALFSNDGDKTEGPVFDHIEESGVMTSPARVLVGETEEGTPLLLLPTELAAAFCPSSVGSLLSGAEIAVLTIPTVDGLAADALIVEPLVKPVYGKTRVEKPRFEVIKGARE